MLNATIEWNGQSSADFNFKVERFPDIVRASRQFDKYSVPARNGDLYYFHDAYNNYQQPYQVYAGKSAADAAQGSWSEVIAWLTPEVEVPTIDDYVNLTVNGYHTLIDSYEPDVIRLAAFTEGISAQNAWNRFGRATINFDCRPERFTLDAFDWLTPTNKVTNPTDRPAKPIIRLKTNSTSAYFVLNGYRVNILSIESGAFVYIDSESQNCFRSLAENKNSVVQLVKGFPVLSPGENTLTKSGITSFELVPRWWRL